MSKFRPYVGLGFGRPVPMKHRFTCNFDLGVQFWGTPEVYLRDNKLEKTTTNSDAGEVLKVISKISVYPSLNIRFVGPGVRKKSPKSKPIMFSWVLGFAIPSLINIWLA